jgi:uncharacterized membrane protein
VTADVDQAQEFSDDALTPAGARPLSLRVLGAILVVCGVVGLAAAFVLTYEKFKLIEDPFYVPSCSINAVLSCGSVMSSDQSQAFGFPNSFLGLIGFSALAAVGAGLLAGARWTRWLATGLQVGVTAGVVFVHWLMVQTAFVIGALCPYCMVVWVVTITGFFYVTLAQLGRSRWSESAAVRFVQTWHTALLAGWFLAIGGLVLIGLQ